MPEFELGGCFLIKVDGALDDGRKIGDKDEVVQEIALSRVLFVVNVIGVGNHGQGKIGQANGRDQFADSNAPSREKILQQNKGVLKELEIAQDRKGHNYIQPKEPARPAFLIRKNRLFNA